MICETCGHEWELLHAHVIVKKTPGGMKEPAQCPKCGHINVAFKPNGWENGD
jgi:uncharacterized Zn finger protein